MRQPIRAALRHVGSISGFKAGQPGTQVGREDAIGFAGLGQDFAPLKDHLVFHAVPVDAGG